MLMHPVMLQFPPIQNHSNDWWSTLFSLRAIWPLIAMNVVQAVKYFDMTAYLSKKNEAKTGQMKHNLQTIPNQV